MPDLKPITENLIAGRQDEVRALVAGALESGAHPKEILIALIGGMDEVGRRFRDNEFYIPEVMLAARAMQSAMGLLAPRLTEAGVQSVGKAAIGTVKGDMHDIGKNLVGMMLKGAGFEVSDLGVNVPPEKFVAAAKAGAQVICLSALLTTTMPAMKKTIEAMKAAGQGAKIIVGGAPVTQAYADEIGADGYAEDAATAVELCKKLIDIK